MYFPDINLFERLAIWVLTRSPRISLLVIKQSNWPVIYTAANPSDETASFVTDGKSEPDSMHLERLFHMPSYGESE